MSKPFPKDSPHTSVRIKGKLLQRTMPEIRAHKDKWDRRFLELMTLVGGWSKDPSTKVGAVIVRPDLSVAAIGYNGFPRGMSDDPELYADRPTKYSRIVHGEMNAILNAHGTVAGCTLYVPFPPCDRCAVHVVQAGITRVVYEEPTDDIKSRWAEAFEQTAAIFADAGIEVTELPRFENDDPFLAENEVLPNSLDIVVKVIGTDRGVEAIHRQVVDLALTSDMEPGEKTRHRIEQIGAAAVREARGR